MNPIEREGFSVGEPLVGAGPLAETRLDRPAGGYSAATNLANSWMRDTLAGQMLIRQGASSALPGSQIMAEANRPEGWTLADEDLSNYPINIFAGANTPREVQVIKDHFDRNKELDSALKAGEAGFSRFIAPAFDVDTLVPIPFAKGLGFMRSAAISGGAVGGVVAAGEVARVGLDPAADPSQLAYTIPGSLILGAALGGFAGRYTKAERQMIFDQVSQGAARGETNIPLVLPDGSVTKVADPNRLVGTMGLATALGRLGNQMPYYALKANTFTGATYNKIAGMADALLGSPGLITRGAKAGTDIMEQSVDSHALLWRRHRAEANNDLDNIFTSYRVGRPTEAGPFSAFLRDTQDAASTLVGNRPEITSTDFFNDITHMMMSNNDRGEFDRLMADLYDRPPVDDAYFQALTKGSERQTRFYNEYGQQAEQLNMIGGGKRQDAVNRLDAKITEASAKMDALSKRMDDAGLSDAQRSHMQARWRVLSNEIKEWESTIVMNKVADRDLGYLTTRANYLDEVLREMDGLDAGLAAGKLVARSRDGSFYARSTGVLLDRVEVENSLRRIRDDIDLVKNTPPEGRAPRDALYFMRLYNLEKIIDGVDKNGVRLEDKLRAKLRQHFTENPYVNGRLVSTDPADIDKRVEEAIQSIRKEATQVADTSVDGFNPSSTITRRITLTNRELAEFIQTDQRVLMAAYESRMAPAIEMKRRYGDADMSTEMWRIKQQMLEDIDEAVLRGDMAEVRRLQDEMQKQIEALEISRDKVLNVFGVIEDPTALSVRAINFAKNYQIMTLMGRAWQAAIPDVGRTMLVAGLGDFFRTLSLRFKSPEQFKMASRESQLAGEAWETTLNIRAMSMAEQQGGMYHGSRIERAGQQGANAMFLLNLLNPWTDFWKGFNGAIISNNIIEATMRVADGAPRANTFGKRGDKELLAQAGINDAMAGRIAAAYKGAGGQKLERLRLADSDNWTDLEAARVFRAAVGNDIRNVIITPSKSDKPNFMSQPMWSMILQFKSFSIASTQRVMMAGMQRPDAMFLNSILAMVAGGFMVEQLRGSIYPTPFEEQLVRAIDYSGVLALFTDINNQIEIASAGEYGLRGLLGQDPILKDPSMLQRVTSPLGPTVSQTGRLISSLVDPDPHKTGSALRSIVPFAGLWPIYPLTQGLQARASDAIAEN